MAYAKSLTRESVMMCIFTKESTELKKPIHGEGPRASNS